MRRTFCWLVAWLALAAAAGLATAAPAAAADPTTVVNTVTGAPKVGVIGDSSLAGVRWYDDYGDLRRLNFVFDAESCRRTLQTSCWSREGYRPETALSAMKRLSGQLGDVLVLMTGYNDPSYGFDEAVDAVMAEARRQQIGHVVWLTLRTAAVTYVEPLHQANARTYRDSNKVLLARAASSQGYLQVADWASYTSDRNHWFENDGVHINGVPAAKGLSDFIAEQAGLVLKGETITPSEPPWFPLSLGETGDGVLALQRALVAAGIDLPGGADGTFGDATVAAVQTFQRQKALSVTGTVDQPTAVALGLRKPDVSAAAAAAAAASTTVAATPQVTEGQTAALAGSAASDGRGWRTIGLIVLVVFGALVALRIRARRLERRRRERPRRVEHQEAEPSLS